MRMSFSKVLAALDRCGHLPVMDKLVDPDTGKNYSRRISDSTRKAMDEGIYLEECITHIEDPRRIRSLQVSKDMKKRIESYAAYLNKNVLTRMYSASEKKVIEMPHFEFSFVMDWIGEVESLWGKSLGILDIKFTSDFELFEMDYSDAYKVFKMSQPALYAFMDAYEKYENHRSIADEAFMAYGAQEYHRAKELIERWVESVNIRPSGFLLVHKSESMVYNRIASGEIDIHKPPFFHLVNIEHHPSDFLKMYQQIRETSAKLKMMSAFNNEYNGEISKRISPSEYLCMGHHSKKGPCPMLHSCVYGRSITNQIKSITLS